MHQRIVDIRVHHFFSTADVVWIQTTGNSHTRHQSPQHTRQHNFASLFFQRGTQASPCRNHSFKFRFASQDIIQNQDASQTVSIQKSRESLKASINLFFKVVNVIHVGFKRRNMPARAARFPVPTQIKTHQCKTGVCKSLAYMCITPRMLSQPVYQTDYSFGVSL